MKKIFTTFLMVSFVLTAHAAFSLTWNYENENEEIVKVAITKDTTLIISEYEEDFFSGDDVMSVTGSLTVSSTPANITVDITRLENGIRDEFCMGNCVGGNQEMTQEIVATLFSNNTSWYTHFYPTEPSITVITYTFDDGAGKSLTLTVKYCYQMEDTAVENVEAQNQIEGIYNLLGQKMPTDNIDELPTGIYIINGKKYIKQQ